MVGPFGTPKMFYPGLLFHDIRYFSSELFALLSWCLGVVFLEAFEPLTGRSSPLSSGLLRALVVEYWAVHVRTVRPVTAQESQGGEIDLTVFYLLPGTLMSRCTQVQLQFTVYGWYSTPGSDCDIIGRKLKARYHGYELVSTASSSDLTRHNLCLAPAAARLLMSTDKLHRCNSCWMLDVFDHS